MAKYDVLIVGAGLFGSVMAREALDRKKSVLVLERRCHIGGNCYTENINGINVHKYGAHIFRTSDKTIWEYMERFCEFNNFINSPIANYKGELFNMPFNMNTFSKMWPGVITPEQAKKKIASQCISCFEPDNLEDHVLSLVGEEIYKKLVKGYTEKQWGKKCSDLPASIMRRIPLRFTYDNNYFTDRFQGIPVGGYTQVINKMLNGAEVQTGLDYLEDKEKYNNLADLVIYSGAIDEYYNFCFGELEYRSLKFEHEILDCENFQGVAVMNYTDSETPYTRIIEHKHFEFGNQPSTIISREYPQMWSRGMEPYYPIENKENLKRYRRYEEKGMSEVKIRFGGRLGEYRYYDMQDTIKSALEKAGQWFK